MKGPCYSAPDKTFIRNTFDSISQRYDLLNQILSFGMSEAWRERSADMVLGEADFFPKTILDLGCGTGKFLECFMKRRAWKQAVGLDFSSEMLKKARETVAGNAVWLEQDFDRMPFLESSFDLVISAFTLRSAGNLDIFLKEVHRVLADGGRVAFLDLTRPGKGVAALFFYPYLRRILPALGWIISGDRKAYRFLADSVCYFQTSDHTVKAMETAGFRNFQLKRFAFGAATLIIAAK